MERLDRRAVFADASLPASAGRRYHPSEPVVMHTHDFLEIAYLVRGRCVHVTAAGSTALQPRMVVAVRPGQRHTYEDCDDVEVFNIALGPELLRRELLWILDLSDLARFLLRGGSTAAPLAVDAGARLESWLQRLSELAPQPASPDAAVALGLVGCALGEIATAAFTGSARNRRISSPVREALRLMADAPAENWTMAALADRTSVSVAHLHRLFAAEVNSSPMAWLTRTRVELAASLLIQGDLTVAEIAHRTGWDDPNHFSRRFRQLTGDSPTEHRLRYRPSAVLRRARADARAVVPS